MNGHSCLAILKGVAGKFIELLKLCQTMSICDLQ